SHVKSGALVAVNSKVRRAPFDGQGRYQDFVQELARLKRGCVRAGQKIRQRNLSEAVFAREDNLRFVNKERCSGIGMGIIETKIPTQRALIANPDIGDLRLGIRQ